ncbi:MAG: hypothetical protein WC291_03875 [Thermodesulfovibrionales bacterium]
MILPDAAVHPTIRRSLFSLLIIALIPSVACADGGVPFLLILNFYLFAIGQVWILFAESFYLARCFPSVARSRICRLAVCLNLVSALAGALLIPLFLSALFGLLDLAERWKGSAAGKLFTVFGRWVIGDNSSFPWLILFSSGGLFVLTYFVTVWIEFRLLMRWREKYELPQDKDFLRISFIMNSISYAGLIGLFSLGFILG